MKGGLEARERRPAHEDKSRALPGMMGQSGKIQKSNEQTHDLEVQMGTTVPTETRSAEDTRAQKLPKVG